MSLKHTDLHAGSCISIAAHGRCRQNIVATIKFVSLSSSPALLNFLPEGVVLWFRNFPYGRELPKV